jgi:hypothetical protein
VDTFYQTSRDRRGAQAIQQGVSAINSVLEERFLEDRATRREAQYQEGVADALREQAGQEIQGVQTGGLFRQNSRFYMAGLNETRGRSAAARFREETALAYQNWEGRFTDDDGSAFRQWMNQRVAEFTTSLGNNQYMLNGALPEIQQIANNLATSHSSFTNQRLATEETQAHSNIYADIFSQALEGDYATPQEQYEAILAGVIPEMESHFDTLGTGEARTNLVRTALQYGNIRNDLTPLFALAHAHDTGQIRLTTEELEALANGVDAIQADIDRDISRMNGRQAAEHEAAVEAYHMQVIDALREDPYAELPEWNQSLGSNAYQEAMRIQQAMITNAQASPREDTAAIMSLNESMALVRGDRAAEMNVLQEWLEANPGVLSPEEAARRQQTILERNDRNSVLNSNVVSNFLRNRTSLIGQLIEGPDWGGLEVGSVASSVYRGMVEDYLIANSDGIDPNNPSAIRELLQEANDFAIQQMIPEYGDQLARAAGTNPTASLVSGTTDVLAAEGDNPFETPPGGTREDPSVDQTDPNITPPLDLDENGNATGPQMPPRVDDGSALGTLFNRATDGVSPEITVTGATPAQGGLVIEGEVPQRLDSMMRASFERDLGLDARTASTLSQAMLINFQSESSMIADRVEAVPNVHGTRGKGYYQLTGDRRDLFESMYGANGYTDENQIRHLVYEFQNNESRAYERVLEAARTGNIGETAAAITTHFLRPARQHRDRRVNEYRSRYGQDTRTFDEGASVDQPVGNTVLPPPVPEPAVTPARTAGVSIMSSGESEPSVGVLTRLAQLAPGDINRQAQVRQYMIENPGIDWVPVQGPNGEIMLVSNDFLRDENGDYIRASASLARQIANDFGARLPRTPQEVDAIEAAANQRIPFQASGNFAGEYPSAGNFERLSQAHTQALARLGISVGRDDIAGGHFKYLMENGAIYLDGVQPHGVEHGSNYADYSQGVRLIAPVTF